MFPVKTANYKEATEIVVKLSCWLYNTDELASEELASIFTNTIDCIKYNWH